MKNKILKGKIKGHNSKRNIYFKRRKNTNVGLIYTFCKILSIFRCLKFTLIMSQNIFIPWKKMFVDINKTYIRFFFLLYYILLFELCPLIIS